MDPIDNGKPRKKLKYRIEDIVVFYTEQKLIDSGMKRCDECGELAPLEAKTCSKCDAVIVLMKKP